MSGTGVSSMTRLAAHFAAGGGATIHLHRYPDQSPILVLSALPVEVTITVPNNDLGEAPMRFARELAAAAARFAEDCERFATTNGVTPAGEIDGPASAAVPPVSHVA